MVIGHLGDDDRLTRLQGGKIGRVGYLPDMQGIDILVSILSRPNRQIGCSSLRVDQGNGESPYILLEVAVVVDLVELVSKVGSSGGGVRDPL